MLAFVVRDVTKKDNLTVVALEPLDKPPFLEDVVPSGCIQHIKSILMNDVKSKEICSKMCDILCNVYMDDDNSRNKLIFLYLPILFSLTNSVFF